MAPNPILSAGPADLLLSDHARFRLTERGIDRDILQELSTSAMADFQVDEKSGHIVFKIENFRVVAKKLDARRFMIMSLFTDDQKPV